MEFSNLGLDNKTLRTISKLGLTKPTEIQSKSIQHVIEGKDVIGESATGSGKTLVFGCAILEQIIPKQGLQALVITPTRELTEQVTNSLKQLSGSLKIIQVYGGVSISNQIRDIPRAEVVVATPGRLLDHLNRRTINLSKIKILVLDEADRMLDMGFIEDIERIIKNCPRQRQTLFFSATIPTRIKDLTKKYMINPIKVLAKNQVDPSKLKQEYYNTPKNMKLSLLIHLLEKEKSELVMVFCNTRNTVDFVVKNLKANKINAIAIHGGLSQNKRTNTIDLFNNGRVSVLVCTDVASRGLHIDNVSHIYNYEIPRDSKDYVHRIGRTARAGEEGKAINILCEYDYDNFSRILRDYNEFDIKKIETPYLKRVIIKNTPSKRRVPRKTFWNRTGNRFPRRPFRNRSSGLQEKRRFSHKRT